MEVLIGGLAACGAGFFTNPLEVVKTRMQLQGELKARGQYTVHYRNVFHAFYNISKVDGILALQKGLVPALWYQFFMNGVRLGAYQYLANHGFIYDKDGKVVFHKSVFAGAIAGCVGAAIGSPIYMVKTHLQALAHTEIAVGHQHNHDSMMGGLRIIYSEQGMRGLWRGTSAAATRVMFGSAAQLSTFSSTKQFVIDKKWFPATSTMNAVIASMFSGVSVVIVMTPFDVVSTRLYNQGVDSQGRGQLYKGMTDCFLKILQSEGPWGFYKGWAASFFRIGPHTVMSLVIWFEILKFYNKTKDNKSYKEEDS